LLMVRSPLGDGMWERERGKGEPKL